MPNETIVNDTNRFINPETMEWGLSLSNVKSRFKNILWGSTVSAAFLETLNYFVITPVAPPTGDVVTQIAPILVDGVWTQQWDVVEYTPDEIKSALDAKRENAYAIMNVLRDQTLEIGVPFDFGSKEEPNVMHIQVRDGDRANQAGMSERLSRNPDANQHFRPYQDEMVTLSPASIILMTDRAYEGYLEILYFFWTLKDSVKKATSIADLPKIPSSVQEVYTHLNWEFPVETTT